MLSNLKAPFRPATASDASHLAELINMAGEGIPAHLWSLVKAANQTTFEYGASRALRKHGSFSYHNAIIAEQDHNVVGMLLAYPLEEEEGDLEDLPPIVRPLVELEGLVPGTFYINALAIYSVYRNQGWGAKFLDLADQWANQSNCSQTSLIVSQSNPAQKLYKRSGYEVVASRPIVPFEGFEPTGDWHLMTKDLNK